MRAHIYLHIHLHVHLHFTHAHKQGACMEAMLRAGGDALTQVPAHTHTHTHTQAPSYPKARSQSVLPCQMNVCAHVRELVCESVLSVRVRVGMWPVRVRISVWSVRVRVSAWSAVW